MTAAHQRDDDEQLSMVALLADEKAVNPISFEPLWDDRDERQQWRAATSLYQLDTLNRHDRRTVYHAVREAIDELPDDKKARELHQMPGMEHWSRLVGWYSQMLRLGHQYVQISVRKISKLLDLSPSYIKFMHRWLHLIGWLRTEESQGIGIKHTCGDPHGAPCGCRERVWNKAAKRSLTTVAGKALRLARWLVARCLYGFDVQGARRQKPGKDFVVAGLPGRETRDKPRSRVRGGFASIGTTINDKLQSSFRFVGNTVGAVVRDMNERSAAMQKRIDASERRKRQLQKARGGDIVAAMEFARENPASLDLITNDDVLIEVHRRLGKPPPKIPPY